LILRFFDINLTKCQLFFDIIELSFGNPDCVQQTEERSCFNLRINISQFATLKAERVKEQRRHKKTRVFKIIVSLATLFVDFYQSLMRLDIERNQSYSALRCIRRAEAKQKLILELFSHQP